MASGRAGNRVIKKKRSVTNSIAHILLFIVGLSVLSSGMALLTFAGSLSDAEAINISGSLRMQSYRLAYDITTDSPSLDAHLTQYRQSLYSPALSNLNRFYVPNDVREKYRTLLTTWQGLEKEIAQDNPQVYLSTVSNYVAQIDDFVLSVQRYSEQKLSLAIAICVLGFIAIITLVLFTTRFIRKEIVAPLNLLVDASRHIQKRDFNYPELDLLSRNEMGVLSRTFSRMSTELAKLYRSLEEKVEEKTQRLTQANQTLEVLYSCSTALSSTQLNRESFEMVLDIVCQNENLTYIQLEVQDSGDGVWVLHKGHISDREERHELALHQESVHLGTLSWQYTGEQLHPQLMQNVATLLSQGISFNRAQKQYHQFLLMEERATIARELHDSLAQALTFLRIQLTTLKYTLTSGNNADTMSIIQDFDQALSDAYRQLRELLTTFRLNIEEADLKEALRQLIQPLQQQTHAKIQLTCALSSQSLNAQQQVHALQIVRESLLNAIKHANASLIEVICDYTEDGYNTISIKDNGIGIASVKEPEGHYGLTIMNERASSLGGDLHIRRLPEGGTEVKLIFPDPVNH